MVDLLLLVGFGFGWSQESGVCSERERERERMLFYSFFKTLVGKEVVVELKNDLEVQGVLHSVDQYLNLKLEQVTPLMRQKYPQLEAMKNCFIRGSVIRYISLSKKDVEVSFLQDAARREAKGNDK